MSFNVQDGGRVLVPKRVWSWFAPQKTPGLQATVTVRHKFSIFWCSLVPRPVRAIRVTRGGLEQSAIARIFPTSLTGDVTSEIAEDDWERGWLCLAFEVADAQTSALVNSVHFLINEPSLPSVGLLGLGSKSVSQEKKKHSQLLRFSQTCEL